MHIVYRSTSGLSDLNAFLEIHHDRFERDGVDPFSSFEDVPTQESLQKMLKEAEQSGTQADWRVAEVDSQVVGYSRLNWWHEDDGLWVYLIRGWVKPGWRGQGLGSAMLAWGEARARMLAERDHPGEPFEFAGNASSTEVDTTALLLDAGYRAGYTVLEMEHNPDAVQLDYPLPDGIDVRPVLQEHIPLVTASIAAAYRKEYEDGRYQEDYDPIEAAIELAKPPHNRSLWQVAWVGDQVIGQVIPLELEKVAVIHEVSVRPEWRRKGLARALLTRALRQLREQGEQVIRLNTVAEFKTRASELYRSVGFRVLKEFPRYRKAAE
jgi:ribosomal protein S18 acetylase RimI-like enzyme